MKKEFSLPCTIALSSNKVVSKIATGTVKPAGIIYVEHGLEKDFLSPLSINVIPGVGKKTELELRKFDINFIRDIQKMPKNTIETILGDYGNYIYRTAMGIGGDTLDVEWKRKSISNEHTFGNDIADKNALLKYTNLDINLQVLGNIIKDTWPAKESSPYDNTAA